MMITKREKRSFSTAREMVSQYNRRFQPEIIVDSGASEHVVSDEIYLTDEEEITPVTVELANGTLATATK